MENQKLKTMLFCTGYVGSDKGVERYRKWIEFYSKYKTQLGIDTIFVIDDGSPHFWIEKLKNAVHGKLMPYRMDRRIDLEKQETERIRKDLEAKGFLNTNRIADPCYTLPLEDSIDKNKVVWLSFNENLGRPTISCIPGWWRSFSFSSIVALAYQFDKVVHIESDSYLLSKRLFDFIKDTNTGYNTLWCPSMPLYGTPETCIQWFMKEFLYKIQIYWGMGRDFWYGSSIPVTHYVPERCLSFTNIWRQFVGDRVGDDAFSKENFEEIQTKYDYICNISDISLGVGFQRNIKDKNDMIENIFNSLMKG